MHDPTGPVGRLLFTVLAVVAEFASDLIRMRTQEGMAVARAAGRLRGRKPELNAHQEAHLVEFVKHASRSTSELFGVGPTVYRGPAGRGGDGGTDLRPRQERLRFEHPS